MSRRFFNPFGKVTLMHRSFAVPSQFVLAIVFVLILGSLFSAIVARAHSWYDPQCCSDQDCSPVAIDDVVETEKGWKHLPTGTEFTRDMVLPSKDNRFHVCIGNREWDKGKPYCIYVLQGS
jgi:hypothetical protein